ncbi:glutamate receptor 2.7-like [Tripterygium wilfordii]|uniref:Glutamate receptor n=1 Tax=Tripterygium wilfordii TaxID=458696 RepID=A0A7J7C4R9_TRIWF|nr:glutamate receptor 2.7-like [Tripterygium wilfordii]KAF5729150.1 glutamate receptor 2.7-like [Tripterygium wilfordii]
MYPQLRPSSSISVNSVSKACFLLCLFILHGAEAATNSSDKITSIGAIIDVSSRIGKEEKTAMEIAVQNFNNNSLDNKLELFVMDSAGGGPLKAAFAAEDLIKQNKVKVIIGMETWEQAVLVADIGSEAQIPVISLASAATTPPLMPIRWPYLVRMVGDGVEQMRCIASIVHSYNWRRVVVIYEDDVYGGSSGKLDLLSEALRKNGSEIEYRLVLPPFSLLSNPKEAIQEELIKLMEMKVQSRVFIVLQASLPATTHLFEEAKKKELVGIDSAWIVADTITDLLDSVDSSVISSMEGALGIKTSYDDNSTSYKNLRTQFRKTFWGNYPEEEDFQLGIHALRAYDSISTVAEAVKRMTNSTSPKMFLETILSTNFAGLSGKINFSSGQLSYIPELKIVNVVGKKYKELDFWVPKLGFSNNGTLVIVGNGEAPNRTGGLAGPVIWPGNPQRSPKGWAMPTDVKPLRIGVPNRTSFNKFVSTSHESGETKYDGFCIKLFEQVIGELPYEFVTHNGTYDELVLDVYNKKYDAAVGDITILANRSLIVEFTQPYMESGLSMIVPAEVESNWIFLKPFSLEMWLMTAGIFIYTTLIVWFLEARSNEEEYGRTRKNQISTALWFTSSTLFFAQKENVKSNFTRVVVVVWMGVVFVLTSSYTASLSSLLTVNKLEPSFESNIRGVKVGSDSESFIKNYLQQVLKINKDNINTFTGDDDYAEQLDSKNISAAFLEQPYARIFMSQNCKKYTIVTDNYRFGGLAFVFQKGSPIATDVSRAILQLSENGKFKELEETWFKPVSGCSTNGTAEDIESLSLHSFWGLYLFTGIASTLCVLIFIACLLPNFPGHQSDTNSSNESILKKIGRFASFILKAEYSVTPRTDAAPGQALDQAPDTTECNSKISEYASSNGSAQNNKLSLPAELQMLQISRT